MRVSPFPIEHLAHALKEHHLCKVDLRRASARANHWARSTSGNSRMTPERGGHSTVNVLLRTGIIGAALTGLGVAVAVVIAVEAAG